MELTKFLVCGAIKEESEAELFLSRILRVQEKQGPFSFVLCCGFDLKQLVSLTTAAEKKEELSLEVYLASQHKWDSVPLKESIQKNVYTLRPFEVFEFCRKLQSLHLQGQYSDLSKGLAQLKPRYSFCSVEPFEYFEYGPFLFEDSFTLSRFIHLSHVGSKQKWLYALSMKPVAYLDETNWIKERSGPSVLPNPFQFDKIVEEEEKEVANVRFLEKYSLDGDAKKPHQASCWFCLANEKDLHLIVDVGQYCFLALAKGYLSKYHLLIVPIEHVGSRFELSTETWKEVQFYLSLLENWWSSMNLQIFWFERSMKPPSGNEVNHMQIQVIGMPIRESLSFVSNLLDRESKRLGVTIWELGSETEFEEKYRSGKMDEYILFKLPDGCYALHVVESENKRKRKYAGTQSPYFALFSFGRKIAALAMNMPQKIDWKKSVNDMKEEEQVTNELREEFLSWKRKMFS
ncbi:CWF19-like protein 1 [Galdieria sulphuraria]|nr:CWF19-like protein 1 [Galdieria sulphuraria]